jgi:hypothetical protein
VDEVRACLKLFAGQDGGNGSSYLFAEVQTQKLQDFFKGRRILKLLLYVL